MDATGKLEAIRIWNVYSENLQNIVDKNATDLNMLVLESKNAEETNMLALDKHICELLPPPSEPLAENQLLETTNCETSRNVLLDTYDETIDFESNGYDEYNKPEEMVKSTTLPNCDEVDEQSSAYTCRQNSQAIDRNNSDLKNGNKPVIGQYKKVLAVELTNVHSSEKENLGNGTPQNQAVIGQESSEEIQSCDIFKVQCFEDYAEQQKFHKTDQNLESNKTVVSNQKRLFVCSTCSATFVTKENLKEHEKCHMQTDPTLESNNKNSVSNPKRPFVCPTCSASFVTKGNLIVHSRTHSGEKPFVCELCHMAFTTNGNLKRHALSHTGRKPYSCKVCGASYTEQKNLKMHTRKHTGERPYQCEDCGKRFSRRVILRTHRYMHTDQRDHECDHCGKRFRQKAQLGIHLLRHEGVKKFSCITCKSLFITNADLTRHLRSHTGVRPFTCDQCPKSFTRMQTLQEHKNVHQGIKPHNCHYCEKAFISKSALAKHIKIHQKYLRERPLKRFQMSLESDDNETETTRNSENIVQETVM